VKITANTISGTPQSFSVIGGDASGDGGGGGGGCIYLEYANTNSITSSQVSISGGSGYENGGGGLLYIKNSSTNHANLYSFNNGIIGAETPQIDSSIIVDSLTLSSSSIYVVSSTKTLILNNESPFDNSDGTGKLIISSGILTTNSTNNFTITSTTLELWSTATLTNASNLDVVIDNNATLSLG
jgi:hypothetical protein